MLLDGIFKCLQGHGMPLTLLQEGVGMGEPYSNVRYKGEQNKLGQADFSHCCVLAPFHARAHWIEAARVNIVPLYIYSLHSKSRCSGAFRKVSADAH